MTTTQKALRSTMISQAGSGNGVFFY